MSIGVKFFTIDGASSRNFGPYPYAQVTTGLLEVVNEEDDTRPEIEELACLTDTEPYLWRVNAEPETPYVSFSVFAWEEE
jgi:hypothetical protein